MKRPDLLILIAVWEFITAGVALIGISVIAVFAFPEVIGPMWGPALVGGLFGLSIAVLLLLCYVSIAVAGGIGLLKGKGWGRTFSIIHAALGLLNIPVGTVIGILIIVYLAKPDVREYFVGGGG
jgi:hypothetical protein